MSQTFDVQATIKQLIGDEGERFFVYDDANGQAIRVGTTVEGNPTIGIGRNLSGHGISAAECAYLLLDDIDSCAATLDSEIPWWRNLSPLRQQQMVNLTFNMGWGNLSDFHQFLDAMKAGNWSNAVAELKDSRWWGQVGKRGTEIANNILSG